jgi:hypothetical protein
MSRKMTPRRDNATPGESYPLAQKAGVCQPSSYYLATQDHGSLVGSTQDDGDATSCPKAVEHQGMSPRQ